MSTEPIDIVVTDKVPDSVQNKFLNIASAALSAYDAISKVQDILDKLSSNQGLAQLTRAQDNLARAATATASAVEKAARSDQTATEAAIAKARATQVAADAQERYNALLGVGGGSSKSARDSAQVFVEAEAAANRAAKAVNAFGEIEAEVAARIKALSNAGADLASKQTSVATTANNAANAENALASATNKSSASVQQSARNYSNYMSALNTLKKDQEEVTNNAKKAAASLEDAGKKTDGISKGMVGINRELLVLGHEIISGNFSRLPGSFVVLAERTGSFSGALGAVIGVLTNPLLVAGLAAIAVIGSIGKAFFDAEKNARSFANAATLTGNIAGLTQDSFNDLAKSIATANNISISSAKEIVGSLQASGRFQKGEIAELGDATVKLSKLTGQSTEDIIKGFDKLADSPEQYIKEFAKFSNINPYLATHIHDLEAVGKTNEAAQLAAKGLFDYLQNNGPQAVTGLSGLFHDLGVEISNALTKFGNFVVVGTKYQTDADKISRATDKLKELQEQRTAVQNLSDRGGSLFGVVPIADLDKQITDQQKIISNLTNIKEQTDASTAAQSANTKANRETAEALSSLTTAREKAKTTQEKYNEEIAKTNNHFDTLINNITKNADATPEDLAKVNSLLKDRQKILDDIARSNLPKSKAAGPATEEENRQSILNKINAELATQLRYYGEISEERIAAQKLDSIDDKLRTHTKGGRPNPLPALDPSERAKIGEDLAQEQANRRVQASEDALYQSLTGPLRAYEDASIAIQELTKRKEKLELTDAQLTKAQNAIQYAYDESSDSLFSYNKSIDDQTVLLGLNSQEQQIASQLQQIQNTLLPKGESLYDRQTGALIAQGQALKDRYTQLQKNQELDRIVQQYYEQNIDAQRKLTVQQDALTQAYQKGYVGEQQYKIGLLDIQAAASNLNISKGLGTLDDSVTSIFARLRAGFKGVTEDGTKAFGDFFVSIEDGVSNSIGKAIVGTESFGDAIRSVAQDALSSLIAALVKIGIQYVITQALGESTAASSLATITTANVAAAEVTAAAWAPAAAAVSLASFGANAAPASIGLAETFALSSLLAAVPGFSEGGFTGSSNLFGGIAGVVHPNEFVNDAASTAKNRPVLEAMNNGATFGVGQSRGTNLKVSIENYGSSKDFQVQQLDESRIRIIANDEAKSVVTKDAPRLISTHIANPNSDVSKAITRNTTAQRSRGG